MKYHLVGGIAATAFTFLAAADFQIPSDCTHQSGWGNAVIKNQCSEDVFFILDNGLTTSTIGAANQVAIPIYMKNSDNGGMSVKLSKDKNIDIWAVPAITQFEITPTPEQAFFDISNVNSDIGGGKNGNGEDCDKEPPFMNDGMSLSTPDGKSFTCEAGQNPCKTAYSKNDDNFATSATPVGNDITLTLCPGGKPVSAPQQPSKVTPQKAAKPAPQLKKPVLEQKQEAKPSGQEHHQEEEGDKVVWVVETLTKPVVAETQVVYQNVNAHKEKRHEHLHQHIHNKVHKRRNWT